ncbi:SMC-Scp complex subunit ScpB [Candidatus Bipolaricaulota bacterium]
MTTQDHPRNDLALVEAALFLASQPLTRRALAKILGDVALAYVDQLLEDLKAQFEDSSRGIELHVEEGRALFQVKAVYVNQVAHLAPQHDIPRQELRTLAVIAYNNPMTQANLIKVRGNKGYKHVQELIERNLIASEPQGRTCLLRVTRDFLRHFGLSSVEEFRFHFPTAAEENAEALARASEPGSNKEISLEAEQEAEGLSASSVENSADLELQKISEDGVLTDVSSADSEPKAPSTEEADGSEPQEIGESHQPLETPDIENVDASDEPPDESSEEPSEEVEDG